MLWHRICEEVWDRQQCYNALWGSSSPPFSCCIVSFESEEVVL